MTVTSAMLRRLAGLKPEAVTEMLLILADQEEAEERRKEAQRERTRKSRERRDGDVTVTVASRVSNVTPPSQGVPLPPAPPSPPQTQTPKESPLSGDQRKSPRDELLVVLDEERSRAVVDHRQRIRKPLTAHGARLLAGKLAKAPNPNAAADLMIERGWQGFEPEWLDDHRATGPPRSASQPRNGVMSALRKAHGIPDERPSSHAAPDHAGPTLDLRASTGHRPGSA